jgi:hypothetical protein
MLPLELAPPPGRPPLAVSPPVANEPPSGMLPLELAPPPGRPPLAAKVVPITEVPPDELETGEGLPPPVAVLPPADGPPALLLMFAGTQISFSHFHPSRHGQARASRSSRRRSVAQPTTTRHHMKKQECFIGNSNQATERNPVFHPSIGIQACATADFALWCLNK